MKKIIAMGLLWSLLSVSYSQINISNLLENQEDTTIQVIPDIVNGTVWFKSPVEIDSVEIRGMLNQLVYKQKVEGDILDLRDIQRRYYYIVFITTEKKQLIQKLFFHV